MCISYETLINFVFIFEPYSQETALYIFCYSALWQSFKFQTLLVPGTWVRDTQPVYHWTVFWSVPLYTLTTNVTKCCLADFVPTLFHLNHFCVLKYLKIVFAFLWWLMKLTAFLLGHYITCEVPVQVFHPFFCWIICLVLICKVWYFYPWYSEI